MSALTKTMRIVSGIMIGVHVILLSFCIGLLYEIPDGCVWNKIQLPFKGLFITLCMSLAFHISYTFCQQKCDVIRESLSYYFLNLMFGIPVMIFSFMLLVPLSKVVEYNKKSDADKASNPDPDFTNCDISNIDLYTTITGIFGGIFLVYNAFIMLVIGNRLLSSDSLEEAERAESFEKQRLVQEQRDLARKQKEEQAIKRTLSLSQQRENVRSQVGQRDDEIDRASQVYKRQKSQRAAEQYAYSDSVSQARTNPVVRVNSQPSFNPQTFSSQESLPNSPPLGGPLLDDEDDELDIADSSGRVGNMGRF